MKPAESRGLVGPALSSSRTEAAYVEIDQEVDALVAAVERHIENAPTRPGDLTLT